MLLAALSSNRRHAFRLNTKDSYDADMCRAVLEFVREREDEVVGRREPLIALTGLSWPGREFDVVGRVRPEAHRLFPKDPDLNGVTFGVFPGYSVEISGAESVDQAAERYGRMLRASDMNRGPSPYVLVRFDNPKTGAGTIGEHPEDFRQLSVLITVGSQLLGQSVDEVTGTDRVQRHRLCSTKEGSEDAELRFGIDHPPLP